MKTRDLFTFDAFGRPRITGARMTLHEVFDRYLHGLDMPFLMGTAEHDALAEVLRLAAELVQERALQDHVVWSAVSAFAQAVAVRYPEQFRRALLFGSQARGTACPHSDADVAIVLAGPLSAEERREMADWLAEAEADQRQRTNVQIHPFLLTEAELLGHEPSALAGGALPAVRRDGVKVLGHG